jgi:hypothetical protein
VDLKKPLEFQPEYAVVPERPGQGIEYIDPTEPVAGEDWQLLNCINESLIVAPILPVQATIKGTLYCLITASRLTSVRFSALAWAICMRSNGS